MEKSSDPCLIFRPKKCSYGMHDGDRISSLPVELLLIILSFLPLKDMVKTSILSKRWSKLWVNTPVLDFNYRTIGNKHRWEYVNWVNNVLRKHKGRYLKQFRICHFLMKTWQEHVDAWLAFALCRKVEILDLDFMASSDSKGINKNYVFPESWFISSGKDSMDGGKSRVLQSNVKFLKSLLLKYVNVTNETIHFLLRNCPFLERLELVGNQILVELVISDPALVLKHLKVKRCRELKKLIISNFNLVSLITWATPVEVLILQDLPRLVRLSIWGRVFDLRSLVSHIGTCFRQLKTFELSVSVLEDFTTMLSFLAPMTKLKRLVIRYKAKEDESLIVLLNVIKSCTNLEEFVLKLSWISPHRLPWYRQEAERLTCERLKVFVFRGYYGRVSDYELLKHVVKSAPALEKIIIDSSAILIRSMMMGDHVEGRVEREARRIMLKQINRLKEFKHIPPHIDVSIVEPCRRLNQTYPVRKSIYLP